MTRYYIPINKVTVEVTRDLYENFTEIIIYNKSDLHTLAGVSYTTMRNNLPKCFIVYTSDNGYARAFKAFNTYQEAEIEFKRLTDGILCVH